MFWYSLDLSGIIRSVFGIEYVWRGMRLNGILGGGLIDVYVLSLS